MFTFMPTTERCIFISHDWYSGWRTKPKAPGQYRTTFTVPGNFFSEGRVTVKVAISTYKPFEVHFEEPDAVAFTVAEDAGGETLAGRFWRPSARSHPPVAATQTDLVS